jgi:hypothetical protein
MDWFESITGFAEGSYVETHARLTTESDQLVNVKTGRRYGMGHLEVIALATLRDRVGPLPTASTPAGLGTLRGDIRQLHRAPEQRGALIQVASQFNLLEMVSPDVSPEAGVTGYAHDWTQGPACAMAAGAGTIYRHYRVPLPGGAGQTAERQINTLADLGAALGHAEAPLWEYRNGYVLCSRDGLARIGRRLAAADAAERERLRGLLRIGLHGDVEVTDAETAPGPRVTQAYCSAMPVAYGDPPARAWEPIARLVLEAAYEATLLAGILNARRGLSNRVLLTRLGGGAFGNDPLWIDDAINRALARVGGGRLAILAVQRE